MREAGDPGRRFVFASVTIPVNKYSSSRVPRGASRTYNFTHAHRSAHRRLSSPPSSVLTHSQLCRSTKNLHSALLSPILSLLPPSQIPEPHPHGSHYLYSPVPLPSFPLALIAPLLSSCKVALHVRVCAEAYSAYMPRPVDHDHQSSL